MARKWKYKIYIFGGCHQHYEYLGDILELDLEEVIQKYIKFHEENIQKLVYEFKKLEMKNRTLNEISSDLENEGDVEDILEINKEIDQKQIEINDYISEKQRE